MRRHEKIQALLQSDDPETENFTKRFELPDCVVREIAHQRARMERERKFTTRFRAVRKMVGKAYRRIIWSKQFDGRSIEYHATKGYRSFRENT